MSVYPGQENDDDPLDQDAVEEERDRQRWVEEARLKQAEIDEVEDADTD